MYDADIDCIQQIIQRSKDYKKETIVAPFALSDKKEITNLYITYDPNMSSLLKPKSDIKLNYSYPNSNFDYDVAQALKVIEVRELEVTSLDDFFISNYDQNKFDRVKLNGYKHTNYDKIFNKKNFSLIMSKNSPYPKVKFSKTKFNLYRIKTTFE
jgi:hypothetical protein